MVYKAQAPGKLIICGEHAVVYGQPALAAAVNLYTTAVLTPAKTGFKLDVKTDIPVGSGMGSSASVSAASAMALLKLLQAKPSKELLNQIVYELEKGVHGTPSGIDNTTVVYGGFIKFQKADRVFNFNKLNLKKALPEFILINSGRPKETTKEMVTMVRDNLKRNAPIIEQIGEVAGKFISNFEKGRFNPELVRRNQRLLEKLRVVGKKAQEIVHQIEKAGGVAKICGAGGIKQGSGILLAYHPQIKKIKTLAQKNNWKYFYAELGVGGGE